MTKVCHITTVHPNRYDVRIFQKECTSLVEAGYMVTLLVNDDLPDENKDGVIIRSIAVPVRNRRERIKKAARAAYIKALEVDADIYHIHDPELLPIAVKLKKKQKKVIFDSHEFTAEQIKYKPYIPKLLRNPISKLYHTYETRCLNKLDGLVVPCTFNGEDYFKSVKVQKVIIGNHPRIEEFTNIERHEIDTDKVCYVGGLTEIRGLFHMIRGCYLAERKLVLIGDITSELRKKMESMPEYGCVEYLGVLPHDVAMKEVSKCAIGLSLLEPVGQYRSLDNLPTKVYEYMIMGMPVVMSDFPFYKNVLERYRFGVTVDSTDDQAIATVIKNLIVDSELMVSMGQEGIKAIREALNWELDGKKMIEFYKGINA